MRIKNNKNKKKKGFTLMEMIIVIAVMAIIGAIAIPSIAGVKNNVAKKADEQSCATIERTAKMVLADQDITSYSATYNITFDGNGGVSVENKSGEGDAVSKELKECLSEIKKPQEQNKTGFTIVIKDSKITAKTI